MGRRSHEPGWLARWPVTAQWAGLLLCSAALAAGLEAVGMPAALLMGPMAAGVVFGTNSATIRVPRLPYVGAQAIVGCLMARAM
ncbi:MAG: AbrB family transcriptional regulator, partial [Alphaproteobacteria bacterium]|nr:AbrB family transcriptional regulator [Alphaproteobacteria bacterium]